MQRDKKRLKLQMQCMQNTEIKTTSVCSEKKWKQSAWFNILPYSKHYCCSFINLPTADTSRFD